MSSIKLLKVGELQDGTQRFQSQLYVGKDTADFAMGTDGIMKYLDRGPKGFDYYPYDKPYTIVNSKEEMRFQPL